MLGIAVTRRDPGPLRKHLTFLADTDRRAGNGDTHAARREVARAVRGDRGGRLREAIALDDRDTEAAKSERERGVKFRAAAQDVLNVPTQERANGSIEDALVKRTLHREVERKLRPFLLVKTFPNHADPHGCFTRVLPQAPHMLFIGLRGDRVKDFFEHARNDHDKRRADLREGGDDA